MAKGSYIIVVTPIDGSYKAYRPKGQPKGMSYVEAHDFGTAFVAANPGTFFDVQYKGAK